MPLSPEQSNSASSGTYFRAVRPTDAEAVAVARGEPVIDSAKVQRLRSIIEAGMWRASSESVARHMLDDASDSPDELEPDDVVLSDGDSRR